MDYNLLHATTANNYLDVSEKKVLVVGCNTGKDCSYFAEFGAAEVFGIDVIDQIGLHFQHEHVQYIQMSVENMTFADNTFDLVYCFATMEHVGNIICAYSEMLRVTKLGGFIYCVAAPLWNSRQGHHKDYIFDIDKYPWIHLRFTRDAIKQMCKTGEIAYPDSVSDINHEIDYMLNSKYFNFQPAASYLQVCNHLSHAKIIRNDLDFEDEKYLSDELYAELSDRYSRSELLALTHTFVAEKFDPVLSLTNDLKNAEQEIFKAEQKNIISEQEIAVLQNRITWMEGSKFWRFRQNWLKIKQFFRFGH
jgi:SAM-dependent methyltransferase